MTRAVFLDRDGTIVEDVNYCRRPEDLRVFPWAAAAISLLNSHGFRVIVVTNQSGLARGYFDLKALSLIHHAMEAELAAGGAHIDAIYYCPHHPDEDCDCRKPKPALILKAATELGLTLPESYMVGDHPKDVQAGRAAGCRTVLVKTGPANQEGSREDGADHVADDLYRATVWILSDSGLARP